MIPFIHRSTLVLGVALFPAPMHAETVSDRHVCNQSDPLRVIAETIQQGEFNTALRLMRSLEKPLAPNAVKCSFQERMERVADGELEILTDVFGNNRNFVIAEVVYTYRGYTMYGYALFEFDEIPELVGEKI